MFGTATHHPAGGRLQQRHPVARNRLGGLRLGLRRAKVERFGDLNHRTDRRLGPALRRQPAADREHRPAAPSSTESSTPCSGPCAEPPAGGGRRRPARNPPRLRTAPQRRGKGNHERVAHMNGNLATAVATWLEVRGDRPGPLLCAMEGKNRRVVRNRLSTESIRLTPQAPRHAGGDPPLHPHDLRRSGRHDPHPLPGAARRTTTTTMVQCRDERQCLPMVLARAVRRGPSRYPVERVAYFRA